MRSLLSGYETTTQAAARLGVGRRHICKLAATGRIEGAQLVAVAVGSRAFWYVPADMTLDDCRRWVSKKARNGRCDTCGIILRLSGDELHANDAADAGRCWDCRKRYGTGGLAAGGSIEGVCDEDLSEVSHAENVMCSAPSSSYPDFPPQ